MDLLDDQAFSSSDYFETIFKNTRQNTIIEMDDQGDIVKINSAFTMIFGFTENDVLGKNLSFLFTEEDRKLGMPQKEIAKVLTKGQAADNNFLVDINKSPVWVAGESILITNKEGKKHILKIIQNINTQKVSEKSIVRLNSFNESILGSIEDVVVVLNRQLELIKANKSFYHFFAQDENPDGKVSLSAIFPNLDLRDPLFEKIRKVAASNEDFTNYTVEIDLVSGEKKAFDISCHAIDHAGYEDNLLLTAHDVTIQKQAEKEREDIIGFVAHELRNPLANIVLCNEMMTQLIHDDDIRELEDYLHRSKNNVMRLNKMIGELYDATKFNSGNFNLEMTVFDFEEMIEEALDTLEVLHPDYSIVVEGECNQPVFGDRYRLIQVVTNFLSNGIKYSNNNTRVVIGVQQDEKNVTVSVKDEGLGISEKQLPRIFGRFFRAERTKNLEGIGLGLYLCRRIIEAHRGKVWAESEEGKGSTFYFSIPFDVRTSVN